MATIVMIKPNCESGRKLVEWAAGDESIRIVVPSRYLQKVLELGMPPDRVTTYDQVRGGVGCVRE